MLMPTITLLYYPEENLFKDTCGRVCFWIEPLVSAKQRQLFKDGKKTIEFINRKIGIKVKLLWPLNQDKEVASKVE